MASSIVKMSCGVIAAAVVMLTGCAHPVLPTQTSIPERNPAQDTLFRADPWDGWLLKTPKRVHRLVRMPAGTDSVHSGSEKHTELPPVPLLLVMVLAVLGSGWWVWHRR